jgi:DNA-binding transcriptional LysR family regulator
MQIEALKIFCDVARLRSFSRSAEENNVTQSTASQTVQNLEERLGVPLVDRSQRPWELTLQGRFFYEGCRDLLDRYSALEREVKALRDGAGPEVRVAAIYSVGLRPMNQHVRTFSNLCPGVRVHLEYQHPERVYESVLGDRADLGIVSFPRAGRELAVIPWKAEPMVLACAPNHRLAGRGSVSPADLSGERFVGFDQGLAIRAEVDRFLRRNKAAVDVVLEFDNIEAIKQAVEIDSGVSILPRPTLDREVQSGALAAVPFRNVHFARPLGIIHRRGRKLTAAVSRFIDLLQKDKENPTRRAAKRRSPARTPVAASFAGNGSRA